MKPKKKTGPEPERLKIDLDPKEALDRLLRQKQPEKTPKQKAKPGRK